MPGVPERRDMSCPHNDTVLLMGAVYREGGAWVARCFNIDYAAQGETPDGAIKACIDGVVADVKFAIENDSLEFLRPAPISEVMKYLSAAVKRNYCPPVEMPVLREGSRGRNRIAHTSGVASFVETLVAGN